MTIPSNKCSGAFITALRIRILEPEYPQFKDGLRQLTILEAELASHERRGWVEVNT